MAQPIATAYTIPIIPSVELDFSEASAAVEDFGRALQSFKKCLQEVDQTLNKADRTLKEITDYVGLIPQEETSKVQAIVSEKFSFADNQKNTIGRNEHLIKAERIEVELSDSDDSDEEAYFIIKKIDLSSSLESNSV